MKKLLIIFCLMLYWTNTYSQFGYHYGETFVSLDKCVDKLHYVQANSSKTKQLLSSRASRNNRQVKNEEKCFIISDNKYLVTSLDGLQNSDYISDIYKNKDGEYVIVMPNILLALENDISLASIIDKYGEHLKVEPNFSVRGVYLLSCDLRSSKEILTLVNELESVKGIKWCEPDMICEWTGHNTNPLFYLQYYLNNSSSGQYDINVVPAWNIQKGSANITVAIIDDGIELDHEDMSGNVLQGYTAGNPNGNGSPINDYIINLKAHGTACAGIVGAKNNNVGLEGVASGVKLLPVNIYPHIPQDIPINNTTYSYNGIASDSDIAQAIEWAASHADILSLSWGGSTFNSTIATAINNAINYGRNGKGCVVVASSGNSYPTISDVAFPANMDDVIAVGATDKYGVIHNYSQRGESLNLVAPSGLCNMQGDVVTTDRTYWFYGFNSNITGDTDLSQTNYTKKFGGTSAACPQVAGVAALVMSKYPNISGIAVKSILEMTAQKLPNMNGENWTGTYGFGLVDAYAALCLAPYWQDCTHCTLNGSSNFCNSETFSLTDVPSNATVTWTYKSNSSYSPSLSPNSSNNTCVVTAYGSATFSGTLCANVKIQGYTAATYSKAISGGGSFIGYYWDGNTYMDVLYSDDNWGTSGNTIIVQSNDFSGKTVKTSRSSSPSNYTTLSVNNNVVQFDMPNLSNGEYLTLWVFGECTRSFNFYSNSLYKTSPLILSILDDSHFLLSLPPQKDYEGAEVDNIVDCWTFRIYNSANQQQVATVLVKAKEYILDTSSWKPGVYIVNANISDKRYSTKIVIK